MKFAIQFRYLSTQDETIRFFSYLSGQNFIWSPVSGPDKRVFCPGKNVWATQIGSTELLASYQGGKPAVGPQRKSGQLGQDGAKSGRAAEAGHHQSHSCSGIQSPKVLALRNHAAGATAQGRM